MTDTKQTVAIEYPRLVAIGALVFLILCAAIFGFAGLCETVYTVDWFRVTWIGGLVALGVSTVAFLIAWLDANSKRQDALEAAADELEERRANAS